MHSYSDKDYHDLILLDITNQKLISEFELVAKLIDHTKEKLPSSSRYEQLKGDFLKLLDGDHQQASYHNSFELKKVLIFILIV